MFIRGFNYPTAEAELTAQFHSAAYTAKLRIRVRAGDTYTIYTFAHGYPDATANSSSRAISSPRLRDISNGGKRVQARPLPRRRHGDEAEIGVISAPGAKRHRLKHANFRRSDATSDRSRPPGDGKVRQGMAVLARKDRLNRDDLID